jgi:bifunctional NMN adenylyltransferase/nudix hydrolase
MKYNTIVYIGRFQPAHNGHIATMQAALEQANRLVVVIGSHNTPRDIKNPWTAPERETMIRECLSAEDNARVSFVYAENRLYSNTFWARNVERLVNEVVAGFNFVNPTIAIIGNGKGDKDTSEYVDYFKQWKRIPMSCVKLGEMPLHATKIRELIFTGHAGFISHAVPEGVHHYIRDFMFTEEFSVLKAEYDFHVKEEKKYEQVPYGSYTRYTADAVVIQSGHVLLIRRGQAPGKGLWALPGGHVDQTETAFEAALRELSEETAIKLQREVLERCVFAEKIFDHPERSMVGRLSKKLVRTTTMAYGFKLDDKRDLPPVKGQDDADAAHWFTFAEITNMRDQLFEDHADIAEFFLARVPEKRIL